LSQAGKITTSMSGMTSRSKELSDDSNCFDYRRKCGTGDNTKAKPIPGILLIGGAEEGQLGEDAATRWFLHRADGGDYLVLRSGGTGSQANWICEHYRDFVSSAAELSIDSRAAANNPEVIRYIRNADALFIAGGNQNEYEDYWEGSAVEEAINALINQKKVPVAGTSAGMAILGDYYYAPAHEGLLSSEILNNPFHHNTKDIYRSDFIKVSFLKHVITDTHLDRVDEDHPETRYGRLFGFLARVVHDTGNQFPVYGIGLEEGAFVAINEKGIAKVFGNGTTKGQDAYFLQTLGAAPEQIRPELPLIWNNNGKAVKVYKISGTPEGSGQFDLNNWSKASGGSWEYWFTTGGASGFQEGLLND
jgi:cyanophycinase-like exopeptidase